MGKQKRQGRTCSLCGARMSNESFGGAGQRSHICKKCLKKHKGGINDALLINRIYWAGYHMNKKNRRWIEELRSDPRENIRKAAEDVYQTIIKPYEDAIREDEERVEAYFSSLEQDEELQAWILENETDYFLGDEFNMLFEKGFYDEAIEIAQKEEADFILDGEADLVLDWKTDFEETKWA